MRSCWARILGPVAIAIYFLSLTWRGLLTYFTPDDVMNIQFLHGWGRVPFGVIVAQAIATFTPEYRPVGGVYYRSMYALFGFHPLPFRIVFFVLLLTNLFLVGRLLFELTASYPAALVCALLFSFHPELSALYYNDGTVYEVLCLSFYVLALTTYIRARRTGRPLQNRELTTVALLLAAALGSKEMAMTFPAVLLLYEILFWPKVENPFARLRPIAFTSGIVALCMSIKVFVPNQMSINELYSPWRPPSQIAANYLHYHQLLFLNPTFSYWALTVILFVALAIGLWRRNRLMLFGLFFTFITLIPVCVIPGRAGFVWYLPLFGYALFIAAAIPERIAPVVFLALPPLLFVCYYPRSRRVERPLFCRASGNQISGSRSEISNTNDGAE